MLPTLLADKDLARRYGRSVKTIRRWAREGKLPAPDVVINPNGRGPYYWREATVREYERASHTKLQTPKLRR